MPQTKQKNTDTASATRAGSSLRFVGAAGTVTGSKHLVTTTHGSLLVDCGLYQGLKELRLRNWDKPPFDVAKLRTVLLTHAHLDHVGYLPAIVKAGFSGHVFATHETVELARIILSDSARLQVEEADRANRYGYSKHSPARPLYDERDVERSMRLFRPIEFERSFAPMPGVRAEFFSAGHLLGAAHIHLRVGRQTVLFSGDVGRFNDPLLPDPTAPAAADTLVIESTYGDRIHPELQPDDEIVEAIDPVLRRGGVVVIPTFAVGRAQSLVYSLHRLMVAHRLPRVQLFVNSPMASEATRVLLRYIDENADDRTIAEEAVRSAHHVESVEESKALNRRQGPMIILSASGMATGGRVLHHIEQFGRDPNNLILFAGYQAPGTRGAAMVGGERQIRMFGRYVSVTAQVRQLHTVSGHADQAGLLGWIAALPSPPKRVFITHGEPTAADVLRRRISETFGIPVRVPNYGERVPLAYDPPPPT
jgi:metallo-beta-lactamase family protein